MWSAAVGAPPGALALGSRPGVARTQLDRQGFTRAGVLHDVLGVLGPADDERGTRRQGAPAARLVVGQPSDRLRGQDQPNARRARRLEQRRRGVARVGLLGHQLRELVDDHQHGGLVPGCPTRRHPPAQVREHQVTEPGLCGVDGGKPHDPHVRPGPVACPPVRTEPRLERSQRGTDRLQHPPRRVRLPASRAHAGFGEHSASGVSWRAES